MFQGCEANVSIIEEAAKRLEQLQKAGIEVPKIAVLALEPTLDNKAGSLPPLPQRVVEANDFQFSANEQEAGEDSRKEPSWRAGQQRNYLEINIPALRAAGFVTADDPESKLVHEFRIIKRPLIRNATTKGRTAIKNGNLIMVTSALPGEGKSFCALNLAMSMAMEVDSTVLLIDADVVAPRVPDLLGIPPTKGLMDVLTKQERDIGDVLYRTSVDRLSVVLAGTQKLSAAELLASEAMTALLEEISSRYSDRIIIFDSPPLLATTESRALASHMGQIVMVVEADKTTQGTLESALATIESCEVVMMVLNKANDSDLGAYGGYYGTGYGYGYGRTK
jgi:receptor protein-tyrosine kinase